MAKITLICTTHHENGQCNSKELLSILCNINPEIIFEELSIKAFKQCYQTRTRFTLEASAIILYLLNHDIKHIPVVKTELTEDLVKKLELLNENETYRQLHNYFLSLESKYGFQFLNSDLNNAAFEKLKIIEEMILKKDDAKILTNLIKSSESAIDNYENGIIDNIYCYCNHYTFGDAVMFIGAAHRKSIMPKIIERQQREILKIEWEFVNEQRFYVHENYHPIDFIKMDI